MNTSVTEETVYLVTDRWWTDVDSQALTLQLDKDLQNPSHKNLLHSIED
jgi:hypothetical protein